MTALQGKLSEIVYYYNMLEYKYNIGTMYRSSPILGDRLVGLPGESHQ